MNLTEGSLAEIGEREAISDVVQRYAACLARRDRDGPRASTEARMIHVGRIEVGDRSVLGTFHSRGGE